MEEGRCHRVHREVDKRQDGTKRGLEFTNLLRTPVTKESMTCLPTKIEQCAALDLISKFHVQKLANTTEKAFADRTIPLNVNRILFKSNNEKVTRQSTRSTMIGNAKIMKYERKRVAKEAIAPDAKQGSCRPQNLSLTDDKYHVQMK